MEVAVHGQHRHHWLPGLEDVVALPHQHLHAALSTTTHTHAPTHTTHVRNMHTTIGTSLYAGTGMDTISPSLSHTPLTHHHHHHHHHIRHRRMLTVRGLCRGPATLSANSFAALRLGFALGAAPSSGAGGGVVERSGASGAGSEGPVVSVRLGLLAVMAALRRLPS
jgi:hypothetical protein